MKILLFKVYNLFILGIVQKKSPWFHYNTRILKLFSTGKLEYYDPLTKHLKGTIILDKKCYPIFKENDKFDLVTKNRTFIFKVIIHFYN